MKKVPVYEHDQDQDGKGAIIGRVTYNDRLDRWDGNNYGNGGTGMHKGISRLTKSGRMVIIIGTQWQGCLDYAYVTSDDDALQEILDSRKLDVLDDYPHLKTLYNAMESDDQ